MIMQYSDWTPHERENFRAWARQYLPFLGAGTLMLMRVKSLEEMYDSQFREKVDALDPGAEIPNGAGHPDPDRLTDLAGASPITREDVQQLHASWQALCAAYLDTESQARTQRCVGTNAILD